MNLKCHGSIPSIPGSTVSIYEGVTILVLPSGVDGLINRITIPNCDLQMVHRAISGAISLHITSPKE